ncbi:protein transport protein Sec61 subunit alpha [Spinacia oleracea]|uniref:Protein transport protein Sec61 subunit alpha n=1 Tax=Spinacia oleracea TaxID=3562 RepID=A0ABM3QS94_SPIOL|nr:protein transport protein Sec61 subunit alpha-like [Spinacia oleracea]
MGDLARPFVDEVQKADKKAPFWIKFIHSVIGWLLLLVEIGLRVVIGLSCILPTSVSITFIFFFPVIMSMLVMELLVWFKILQLDQNVEEDRALWNRAQKLLGTLIAISMAVACVLCGVYGSVDELGVGNAILKVVQLCIGGIIIIFLDEIKKRYSLEYKEISSLFKTVTVRMICLFELLLSSVLAGVLIVLVVFIVYQDGIVATANLVVEEVVEEFTRPINLSLVLLILLALCLIFLKKSEKKKLM